MTGYLPCLCGEEAQLEFDGGWLFRCYECGLHSKPVFSVQAAKKEFRLLVAKMEKDE